MKKMVLLSALVLLALGSVVFAGCATDAYQKACSNCKFDSQGKMDQSCYQGYQASGTACVSAQYPVMSAAYAGGKCPQVDACASTLQSCTSAISSGNDSEDCQGGVKAQCFHDADTCVMHAAMDCGEKVSMCAPSSFLLLFLGLGVVLVNSKK